MKTLKKVLVLGFVIIAVGFYIYYYYTENWMFKVWIFDPSDLQKFGLFSSFLGLLIILGAGAGMISIIVKKEIKEK